MEIPQGMGLFAVLLAALHFSAGCWLGALS